MSFPLCNESKQSTNHALHSIERSERPLLQTHPSSQEQHGGEHNGNVSPSPQSDKETVAPASGGVSSGGGGGKSNALPSYTAMIAQAILHKGNQKSTLSEIYEYMEMHFLPLKEKGNGWRNCVRHTLSLSDCFVKLHRPENGRSCHWAIHPSYLPRFLRGDFRKRRQSRTRRNYSSPTPDGYVFQPPNVYDRQTMYRQGLVPPMSSATGDMFDSSRLHTTCSPIYPQHSHFQGMHPFSSEAAQYNGMYPRDFQSCNSYHPYLQGHSTH